MKPTAPLAAILLSITLAPAHALVIHPDIWFSSDNGNIQCGGYSQYGSSVVCEIYQRTDNIQPRTARPETCQKRDWGYRFALDDYGEARAFCVDDKLRNLSATPLANGATQRRKTGNAPPKRTVSPAKTPTATASRSPPPNNASSRITTMTAHPNYPTDKLVIKYLLCGGAVGGLIMGTFALPRQPEKGELK
ncbi:DUF6636 domain-containing protein [Kingella oralis]|uniref:DUF6636 domain-containing protein n=1 Tax=Kingella oralis TaxID=505 RepID=UPI002D7F26A2|nr:DUF6636 domain-containing protein [Kingella oralis]